MADYCPPHFISVAFPKSAALMSGPGLISCRKLSSYDGHTLSLLKTDLFRGICQEKF